MSDRGGKGFSSASKGKSLASRPGAPNGRQNNSANISYVTVDSDSDSEGFAEEVTPIYSKSNGKAASESLKTGGKASSFSKGEAGKGGMTYRAGKGGKGSSSNAMPKKSDADVKLELAELLQEIHEHMAILLEDPKIEIPESFDKAFQYAKEGNHFTTAKSVKQFLDCIPLKTSGVNGGEICLIANIDLRTLKRFMH